MNGLPLDALWRVIRVAVLAYAALGVVVYLARHRIAFPSPRDATPEPRRAGFTDGETVTIRTADGEQIVGWYFPAPDPALVGRRAPALLWLHGNGETVAALAPIIHAFRPRRAALLVIDYRGYGSSTGRATPAGTILDAEAAYDFLAARPEVDPARIVVYGRSVGSGPAVHLAARRRVAALVLESAFTSFRAMARLHYPIFPAFLSGRGFDNLGLMAEVRCPILFVHGDADRTVPLAMGRALAEAAARSGGPQPPGGRGGPGRVAGFRVIAGADHNTTYVVGGAAYARWVREFVEGVEPAAERTR